MSEKYQDFTSNDSLDTLTSNQDIGSTEFMMPGQEVYTQKRTFAGRKYGEPPAKRTAPSIMVGAGFKWNLQTLTHAADAVQSGGKSPVSALNELGVKVHYTVLRQAGPAHCPSFTVSVHVADMKFEGWGHSKREARAAAARACLAALLARAGRVLCGPTVGQDFTSDEPSTEPVSEFQCLEPKAHIPENNMKIENTVFVPPPIASASSSPVSLFGIANMPPIHKSPINILYENYPGLTFVCTYGDGTPLEQQQAPLQLSHSMRFKVLCLVKDQKFEGYGSSKKLAKLAAARSALAVLECGKSPAAGHTAPTGFLPQIIADHVAQLVMEKFNDLMKNDVVHSKRKVLAGIVMTIDNRTEGAKVITVTTGTKCVSGEHMSVTGRAVNDCHAEVAARRCLQRHLYSQLLQYASQPDPRKLLADNDLEPIPSGGYQLKPDRQLHLYVSTAPCGDGRIFSPHERHEMEPDKHPNRLARGQLRTKIESGEGTIPVKNSTNVVQTWDGVMQGERLLTMSCSDKVARWCVAGLQGALLSRLLKPVYLHSLVLGSLLHPHHMYRAICGRIEAYISSLPPPFRLHRPLLARAASTEARTPARAPSFSVCWCCTTPLPEIINATTGKLEGGQPSLLCKQSMFARWQFLVRRLPLLQQEPGSIVDGSDMPADLSSLLYNEAKQLCPQYQIAKQCLTESFEKAKLGRWIKKPIEQDQFVCEIVDAEPLALFAWAGRDPSACGTMHGDTQVGGIGERHFDEHLDVNRDDRAVINEDLGVADVIRDVRAANEKGLDVNNVLGEDISGDVNEDMSDETIVKGVDFDVNSDDGAYGGESGYSIACGGKALGGDIEGMECNGTFYACDNVQSVCSPTHVSKRIVNLAYGYVDPKTPVVAKYLSDRVNNSFMNENLFKNYEDVGSHVDWRDFGRNDRLIRKTSNIVKDNDSLAASHVPERFDLIRVDNDNSLNRKVSTNINRKPSNNNVSRGLEAASHNLGVDKVLRTVIDDRKRSSHVESFEYTDITKDGTLIARDDAMHNIEVQNRIRNVNDVETIKDNEENNSFIGNKMSDKSTDVQRHEIQKFNGKTRNDKHAHDYFYNSNNYKAFHNKNNLSEPKRSVSDRLKLLQNINFCENNKDEKNLSNIKTDISIENNSSIASHTGSHQNAKDSVVNSLSHTTNNSNVTHGSLNNTCEFEIPKISDNRISFWKNYYKVKQAKRISGKELNNNECDIPSTDLKVKGYDSSGRNSHTKANIHTSSNPLHHSDESTEVTKASLHSHIDTNIPNNNPDTKVNNINKLYKYISKRKEIDKIESTENRVHEDMKSNYDKDTFKVISAIDSKDKTCDSINVISTKVTLLNLEDKVESKDLSVTDDPQNVKVNSYQEEVSSCIQNKRLLRIMKAYKKPMEAVPK